MPAKGWKPKERKKGYRRFLCAPRKGSGRKVRQNQDIPRQEIEAIVDVDHAVYGDDVLNEGFLGFDVTPPQQSIKVLSLFDGIGAAKVALDAVGIQISEYISSEIDEKAIKVLKYHYHDKMKMVGCVKSLTEDKLSEFGSIHLLLAGSPCSDFSLCNPARRNLHGEGSTGQLFFEFKRILDYLTEAARVHGHDFYWLFENTFSMEKNTKDEISSCLGCKPAIKCATSHRPMKRKRCFWGTVPGLYSPEDTPVNHQVLQDYLKPYRKANVSILPTLTSSSYSQRKGRKLPITEDDQDGYLYITEEESIFGFEEHYTDVNLSITDRRRLLGRSWCIPVIKSLLQPLADVLREGGFRV
ncbi:DNA (cytosine-5)-methyltransferase 3C-like [Thrips palmi]|uniref:DNA (cytosine-5-)-methyltransferase n=1 Tax=Thrips palmi TaxID=161013 RepID=A0A6P9A8Y9_THRPL|nr:DNA (cytosine-5)-methyltransferase 3C-like [Thrips palmi]